MTDVTGISGTVPAPPRASRRLARFRTTSLAFLVASGFVNIIDRSTLAIANPLIRHDLGLSIRDMGFLLSAFLWTYAIAQLPIGAIVDRVGARILLTCSQILWSVAQGMCGLAGSFGQFFAMRLFLGVGEAPQFPVAARVVHDCFNTKDRGLPMGIIFSASTLGPAVAAPLITSLMLAFGWRWMFVIMGITGILVAVAWFFFYRNPSDLDLDANDRFYLDATGDDGARRITWTDWCSLFRYRTTWGMVLGYFGLIYLVWLYTAWLPGYLEMDRHMTLPHTGLVAAIPFLFGFVGVLSGGYLIDHFAAIRLAPITACKVSAVSGLVGMALFTAVAATVDSSTLAVACISAAMFLGFGGMAGFWTMVSVAAPKNYVGSLGSIMNCGGYVGGAAAPMLTGMLVQYTHSFMSALLIAAGIGLSAALCCFLVVKQPLPEPRF
jgi:MFS family permease